MRLTEHQRISIIENAKIVFVENSRIYLFGSRVDDNKRGGDIDMFIECDKCYNEFKTILKFKSLLQRKIGSQKIDVVVKTFDIQDDRLVVAEALSKGILL